MKATRNRGITLVEVIIAVVVVGLLAAVALPRMINLGRDARIAAVEGLAASMWSAATLASAQCHVAPTCDPSVTHHGSSPPPHAIIQGVTISFHHGWPIAWWGYGVSTGMLGFTNLLDITGFTTQNYISGSYRRVFTKDGAPDPNNCAVTYQFKRPGVRDLEILRETTGC